MSSMALRITNASSRMPGNGSGNAGVLNALGRSSVLVVQDNLGTFQFEVRPAPGAVPGAVHQQQGRFARICRSHCGFLDRHRMVGLEQSDTVV